MFKMITAGIRKAAVVLMAGALLAGMTLTAGTARADTTYVSNVDYSKIGSWMYLREGGREKDADVFFVAPTSTLEGTNADITQSTDRAAMLVSTNMEIGIYYDNARIFAPFFNMGAYNIYTDGDEAQKQDALDRAYADIRAAFEYYLENENGGRPLILAGFSQGADMCYRLLEDYYDGEKFKGTDTGLVAAYTPGWPVTDEMLAQYPQLKMAKGETDTGVIVSFECESEDVTGSLILPAGQKMNGINPLNWKTTSEKAGRNLNKGFVFVNGGNAQIMKELKKLCGAYLDPVRGTLKVTDITADEYQPMLPGMAPGEYHYYDYMFFYRNLEENVVKRIAAYKKGH